MDLTNVIEHPLFIVVQVSRTDPEEPHQVVGSSTLP